MDFLRTHHSGDFVVPRVREPRKSRRREDLREYFGPRLPRSQVVLHERLGLHRVFQEVLSEDGFQVTQHVPSGLTRHLTRANLLLDEPLQRAGMDKVAFDLVAWPASPLES